MPNTLGNEQRRLVPKIYGIWVSSLREQKGECARSPTLAQRSVGALAAPPSPPIFRRRFCPPSALDLRQTVEEKATNRYKIHFS